jgi:hypothetical protein
VSVCRCGDLEDTFALEWQTPEYCDAEAPNILLDWVASEFVVEEFRCLIIRRSDDVVCGCKAVADSEVGDFDLTALGNDNVLGLDILAFDVVSIAR